jgi:hypothetical protein
MPTSEPFDGRRWVLASDPVASGPTPVLDAQQQAVVDHRTGPLVVLAGPGTGKTTTIVAAIAARIERDGEDPRSILALTFGRKAAADLRDRLVARLPAARCRPCRPSIPMHTGSCSARHPRRSTSIRPGCCPGPRRTSASASSPIGAVADGTIQWPADLQGAVGTLGLADEIRAVLARAKDLGLDPATLSRIGAQSDRPAWAALGELARQEAAVGPAAERLRLRRADASRRRAGAVPRVASELSGSYRAISVDEYRDTDRMQVALLACLVGPQTALVAVGDPDQAIYGFRGADVTGFGRFPTQFPDQRRPAGAGRGAGRHAAVRLQHPRCGHVPDGGPGLAGHQPEPGPRPSAPGLRHRGSRMDRGADYFDSTSPRLVPRWRSSCARRTCTRGLAWSQMAVLVP